MHTLNKIQDMIKTKLNSLTLLQLEKAGTSHPSNTQKTPAEVNNNQQTPTTLS